MKRLLITIFLTIIVMAAVQSAHPKPPPFALPEFAALVERAHLSGCTILEHPPHTKSPCLDFRRALLAAYRSDIKRSVREAHRSDAITARRSHNTQAAGDAIDRKVAD